MLLSLTRKQVGPVLQRKSGQVLPVSTTAGAVAMESLACCYRGEETCAMGAWDGSLDMTVGSKKLAKSLQGTVGPRRHGGWEQLVQHFNRCDGS
jgi:hypothetical protein